MELDITKIKELLKDEDSLDCFTRQLDLILLVEYNFEHIQQLETLIALFKGGLSPYYKEYYKDLEFLTLQAGIIAENTRCNHYNKGEHPDIHSLFVELIGKESTIVNYKAKCQSSQLA